MSITKEVERRRRARERRTQENKENNTQKKTKTMGAGQTKKSVFFGENVASRRPATFSQKHGLRPFWCRCHGFGVQVFRCSGVQVFWCSGVQVCRCAGYNEDVKRVTREGAQKMAKILSGVKFQHVGPPLRPKKCF